MEAKQVFRIPRGIADEMIVHAREESPNECCGLLAGREGRVVKLYHITNSAHSPTRYHMDGLEQLSAYRDIESMGWTELGVYHSHPTSEAYPSAEDRKRAWEGYVYVIVSLVDADTPCIRGFKIENGQVLEVELDFVTGEDDPD